MGEKFAARGYFWRPNHTFIDTAMRNNLSSQITLTRVPEKYYKPENAYEYSLLTRFEKVRTHIYATMEEGAGELARELATSIRERQREGKQFVLAVPGGRSPYPIFRQLIRMHREEGLSLRNVVVFLIYEFYPLTNEAYSNMHLLREVFLDHVDIPKGNVYSPDGFIDKNDSYDFCRRYEQRIR